MGPFATIGPGLLLALLGLTPAAWTEPQDAARQVVARGEGSAGQAILATEQTRPVAVGSRVRAKLEVRRQGRYLVLRYLLLDAAGRERSPGNTRGDPPRFTVSKDGRQIGSGRFEYG